MVYYRDLIWLPDKCLYNLSLFYLLGFTIWKLPWTKMSSMAQMEKKLFVHLRYQFHIFYIISVLVSLSLCYKNFIVNFMRKICMLILQMCFMKENMKILQDKLLKKMVNQLPSLRFSNGINMPLFLLVGNCFTGFLLFRLRGGNFSLVDFDI